MKKLNKKKILISAACLVTAAALGFAGYAVYGSNQMKKLHELSFKSSVDYTLKGSFNGIVTVGILQNGKMSYKVYGKNGAELPLNEHIYEIGSLTKTFTALLIEKALNEGLIELDATIDQYLTLSEDNTYPTVKQLLTHTSGLKSNYFENVMIENFLTGKNSFYKISKQMVFKKLSKLSIENKEYPFDYSNYGYAVLGLIVEAAFNEDYINIVNKFVTDELKLVNTGISDNKGDLGKYWDWETDDGYLSAGGLTSNITDMLSYAKMQLEGEGLFSSSHKSLKAINAASISNESFGIHVDEMSTGWIIDNTNNFIWHNGGTGNYNCYLGFSPQKETAVVVLSNLAPSYKIPATVLGIKLLKELCG